MTSKTFKFRPGKEGKEMKFRGKKIEYHGAINNYLYISFALVPNNYF